MSDILPNFELSELFAPDRLAFMAAGFAAGRMKARKMGAAFVKLVRRITPAPIRSAVLNWLNRFAKGVDTAIKDKESGHG